jgi:hypothetical protein
MPAYEEPRVPSLAAGPAGTDEDLVAALRTGGATNIVLARGMLGESVVTAVMADHLDRIYLFLDGSHLDSVEIPHDPGASPVHPTVKIIVAGSRAGLLLLADGLAIGGKPCGLLSLFDESGVRQTTPLPIQGLAAKHGGLHDPYIGGTDLGAGILISARDDGGKPWRTVYVLSLDAGKIGLATLSPAQACACSSYLTWRQGQDGRTLFGMVVD